MNEQLVNENPEDVKPVNDDDDVSVKRIRGLFSFLSIFLVMIGQLILYTSPVREDIGMPPSSHIDPIAMQINITIALIIIGVLLFILSQGYQPPRFLRAWFDRAQVPDVIPWVLASLALSLLAVTAMLLFEKAQLKNYIPVVTIWFFAALCYAAGFIKGQISVSHLREWLKLHRNELLAIGLLTLFGIALRFYALGDIPKVVNGDEGRVGIAALSTNTYPFVNPFSLWENFGALYLQGINLFLTYFGATPFALRLAAAIGGTLAIPAVYLLARQISGTRIAFIAASLIAISHDHLHFSRTVAVAYIQGTWLIPLEFYFLLSGISKRSSWRTAIAGMLLALHYSVYLDAQIVTALVIVYMLIAFVFLRSWIKPALRQVAVFWGGFAIMFLPELAFIVEHPGDFFNRLAKDGMFQTNWLPTEIANTGNNVYQILAQRIVHVFLSMIYYPAFDFYGASVPVLSLISAVLFLLGLGILLWKTNSPGFLLLNGQFWSGVLAIALFSLPASADSYRLLIVLPTAVIMMAVALDYILGIQGVAWSQARGSYITIVTVALASLLVFNLWTYYVDFAAQCKYGSDDGPTRFASYLGNYARSVDRGDEIYLLSDQVYKAGTHQSVDFLSGKRIITNFTDPITSLQAKAGAVVIASPNRIAELQAWAETHMDGKVYTEYDCGSLMLYTFQFP
jgi:hypothetical protein